MSAIVGQNQGEVRVAITGHVYVAPVGTAAPTNIATALNAAFQDLGYLDASGVVFSKSDSFDPIGAWQSTSPLRYVPKDRTVTAKFVLQQVNSVSLPLWGNGGAVAVNSPSTEYDYTISDQLTPNPMAYVFDGIDSVSNYTYRFYMSNAMVTATTDLSFARSTNMQLGLTVTALTPVTGSNLLQIFSTDPNLTV